MVEIALRNIYPDNQDVPCSILQQFNSAIYSHTIFNKMILTLLSYFAKTSKAISPSDFPTKYAYSSISPIRLICPAQPNPVPFNNIKSTAQIMNRIMLISSLLPLS
jgi:hypothetical protein